MTPTEFQKINKLYHYTKFENAKSIIQTNSLKFGRLNDMNDVYEAYKHISDRNINTDVGIKQIRNILMSYMQLSPLGFGEGVEETKLKNISVSNKNKNYFFVGLSSPKRRSNRF